MITRTMINAVATVSITYLVDGTPKTDTIAVTVPKADSEQKIISYLREKYTGSLFAIKDIAYIVNKMGIEDEEFIKYAKSIGEPKEYSAEEWITNQLEKSK